VESLSGEARSHRGSGPAFPADAHQPDGDPRWDDLSIQTGFDKFVTAAVTRYKGKPIAWEMMNEPEIHEVEPGIYFNLVKRTRRLVKAADPKA
jgi:hypothetical protein